MSALVYDAEVDHRDVRLAFEVAAGETLAVLGPNGAGKSTLLAVVAGLLRPSRGGVRLGGRDLAGVPPHDRRVALLAQDPLLFPHLDALDNVAFGPRARGRTVRAARAEARRWLAEVGVDELAERRPRQLSGGQAQRVAVARALAAEPDLLLLDEPMAALDVTVAPAIRHLLRRVLHGRTTILVTHDPLDALLLADRVVVLEAGRVVEHGPTAEVLARPRSSFGARIAGLNLVVGTWDGAVLAHPVAPLVGLTPEEPPPPGARAIASFSPAAVSVFLEAPHGSPRNTVPAVVTDLEPLGDRIRVRARAGGDAAPLDLAAEVTPAAVADLDLAPGSAVQLVVKATEVRVYAASP